MCSLLMSNSLCVLYLVGQKGWKKPLCSYCKCVCVCMFQTKVLTVTPRPDFAQSGQWVIETEDRDGKREKHMFDAVLICTGHHCHPNLPLKDFPGTGFFIVQNAKFKTYLNTPQL